MACSLSLDFDGRPCMVDDDCVYRDGPGICVEGTCQPSNGGSDGASDSDGTGATAADDGDGPNDSDGTAADDEPTGTDPGESGTSGCSENSDCSDDERCGDAGVCVGLLSPECQTVQWPASGRDDVVFVGSILPKSGLFTHLVQPFENAIQLAVEDFNSVTALQADRAVAWVACDSTAGPAAAVEAARHLVDNVGVPAIVGPLFSEETEAVANQVTIDAGVLVMASGGSTEVVTNLDDDDLVWRTLPDDVYQANGIADLMLAEDPAKVLFLAQETAHGEGLLEVVLSGIDGNFGEDQVVSLVYPDPITFGTEAAMLSAYGQIIAQAFESLPDEYVDVDDHYTHVVILGTSEAQALFYAYMNTWLGLQSNNPEANNPPMPSFYFTTGGVIAMEPTVDEIGSLSVTLGLTPYKEQILANLDGIAPVVFDDENFDSFNIRYKVRFSEQDALTVTSLAYDGMMAVLFAMCTVPGDTQPTGAALAAAIVRLNDPNAPLVSFSGTNLDFITQARNAMIVPDGAINLRGVSGELDWDERGGVRADVLHWQLQDVGGPGTPDARLDEHRIYRLDAPPAVDGQWEDF